MKIKVESFICNQAGRPPLIHLDELSSLDILADFGNIFVPNAVWCEVEHHRPQALKH